MRGRCWARRPCSMSSSPSGEVADYRATMRGDAARTKAFNAGLRTRGIFKGESKFYLSVVHTDEDIANTLDAARESLKELS